MSVAQTKAARRKFRVYYRNDTPIGTPHYKRRSTEAQQRQLHRQLEKLRLIAARKGKRK